MIGTNHTTVAGFAPHLPLRAERAAAYVMWFYNRCDYVTAPSRSVFEELGMARLCRPHQVVSNPIDTELFAPLRTDERDALRAHFGLAGPTITYAGRLGPRRTSRSCCTPSRHCVTRAWLPNSLLLDTVRTNRYCEAWRSGCESIGACGSLAPSRRTSWPDCYG